MTDPLATVQEVLVTVEQVENVLQQVIAAFGLDSAAVLHVAAQALPELAPVPPDELTSYLAARSAALAAPKTDPAPAA